MMYVFFIFLALLSGICSGAQSSTNTTLARHVGRYQSPTLSFLSGTVLAGLLALIAQNGDITKITEADPWMFIGGTCGAFIVIAIVVASPKLGIALTLAANQLGQVIMGLLIDAFGFVGQPKIVINVLRVIACIVLFIGIYLVYKGKQNVASGQNSKPSFKLVLLLIIGGMYAAFQAPANAALSRLIGSLNTTAVCCAISFVVCLVVTLILQKGKMRPIKGAGTKGWMYLGGLYGLLLVLLNMLVSPVLGMTLLVAGTMLGQLFSGLVLDTFGWLGTEKVRNSFIRVIGIIVIAAGMILLAIAKMR